MIHRRKEEKYQRKHLDRIDLDPILDVDSGVVKLAKVGFATTNWRQSNLLPVILTAWFRTRLSKESSITVVRRRNINGSISIQLICLQALKWIQVSSDYVQRWIESRSTLQLIPSYLDRMIQDWRIIQARYTMQSAIACFLYFSKVWTWPSFQVKVILELQYLFLHFFFFAKSSCKVLTCQKTPEKNLFVILKKNNWLWRVSSWAPGPKVTMHGRRFWGSSWVFTFYIGKKTKQCSFFLHKRLSLKF